MADKEIFYADAESLKMTEAFKRAQETFKYFWRELSWEFRRIIPALEIACVKVAFSEDKPNGNPIVEHMWINNIDFDGYTISGTLINDPGELTNIKNGDPVKVLVNQISDWLFATQGKTHGGFTIQAMRSDMSSKELKQHDKAWGLDFGDFNDVLVVYQQKEHPENLTEHPMSRNMRQSLIEFIEKHPNEVISKDANGYTFLHRETIAGNKTSVEILLDNGADKNAVTNNGQTALDFARLLNWEHIIGLLE